MAEHHVYYSGDDTVRNRNGVAIIVREIAKAGIGFTPISSKVILLKILSRLSNINVIQAYAAISESTEVEIENFYHNLEHSHKKHELNIVIDDFNAKIEQGTVENLGTRNEREMLIQFFEEMDMVVTETFFKLHPWKAPEDIAEKIIRLGF